MFRSLEMYILAPNRHLSLLYLTAYGDMSIAQGATLLLHDVIREVIVHNLSCDEIVA